jgi:hypothetical protein
MLIGNYLRLPVVAPFLCCAVLGGGPVHADIYTWTDAQGSLNFSNVAPPKSNKVKNVRVIAKDTIPVAQVADPVPPRQPAPSQRELLARISNLEHQLAEQQAQQQIQRSAAPSPGAYYQGPPPPSSAYYQPPPPGTYYQPTPTSYNDASADAGFYPGYPVYYYPIVPAYSVYPRRAYFVGPRPAFGGFVGGRIGGHGGGHR